MAEEDEHSKHFIPETVEVKCKKSERRSLNRSG
jgi:hypothetical protein